MWVVAIYYTRKYPTRRAITWVLSKYYAEYYLGSGYGKHDRSDRHGEVVGVNVRPMARYRSSMGELVQALNQIEGMDAEVVPQGRNELFYNELPDFSLAPPRTSEGATQRLHAYAIM